MTNGGILSPTVGVVPNVQWTTQAGVQTLGCLKQGGYFVRVPAMGIHLVNLYWDRCAVSEFERLVELAIVGRLLFELGFLLLLQLRFFDLQLRFVRVGDRIRFPLGFIGHIDCARDIAIVGYLTRRVSGCSNRVLWSRLQVCGILLDEDHLVVGGRRLVRSGVQLRFAV